MSDRTIRTFTYDDDVFEVVDRWAHTEGYGLVEANGTHRLYQKSRGFHQLILPPMKLEVRQNGSEIGLEAWVRSRTLWQLYGLFLSPAEIGLESGGIQMWVPRRVARNAVNQLLKELGQPPIP